MSMGTKYTLEERQVVYKIEDVNRRMLYHRKKYLDLDVKKIDLIHSLKGKYVPKYDKKHKEAK